MTDAQRRVARAIEAFKAGALVVVTDDDDRENEGDLICAASLCSPEKMAFIIRHTSGIVCAPLTETDARRLHLDPMVARNDAPMGTAFTVTVDARHGVTTGISAEERTTTVRALANGNMGAADFVRPGHVFPLIARDGGVLMRSGHTEAAVDLCRLAGLPPVGVIGELMNDDGTVMHGPQVSAFAQAHAIPMLSVADLIGWRQQRDRLVARTAEFTIETASGAARGISFGTPFDRVEHLALVFGEIGDGHDVLVRLHREQIVRDVFGADRQVARALARLAQHKRGVLIYLREGTAGVPTQAMAPGAAGTDETHRAAREREENWREVGLGAQILKDLGIHSIRLLASKSRTYVGLGGFGIEIVATELL